MLHESAAVPDQRRLALAVLDRASKTYHAEVEQSRRGRPLTDRGVPLADKPIRSIEAEANDLVSLRYGVDAVHAIYMAVPGGDRTTPACQRNCDGCHRVQALTNMAAFCDSRADYLAFLAWIMDPDFLQ